MGNMAVGATFWHCGNRECNEYCRSIKLVYCYGCGEEIDSRVNTVSCDPHEIKAYKKFYICGKCASCCKHHGGTTGRCPKCGTSDAFANVGFGNRTRANCRNDACDAVVSLDNKSYKKLVPESGALNKVQQRLSSADSAIAAPSELILQGKKGLRLQNFNSRGKLLYVYDLFYCLDKGLIIPSKLSGYEFICDLKLIDRMTSLGLNHPKYKSGVENDSIESVLQLSLSSEFDNASFQKLSDWLARRFEVMRSESLWDHYKTVELPFTFALSSLLGKGIEIKPFDISNFIHDVLLARYIVVEELRTLGIDTPDKDAFLSYIEQQYSRQDAWVMRNALLRGDTKALRIAAGKLVCYKSLSELKGWVGMSICLLKGT